MRMILGLDRPDRGGALVGGPYWSLRTPLLEVGALLDAAACTQAGGHTTTVGAQQRHSHTRVGGVLELVGLAPSLAVGSAASHWACGSG
jgi:ABC-2 type transport system ATP-binding protein